MANRLYNLAKKLKEGRPSVGTTPADVIHRENKWTLLRYRSDKRSGLPVLLVPSLINRHYVLDLMPGKSFVEYLLDQGHDVFIINWGTPGREDRFLTFEDICVRYLGRAIRKTASYSPNGKTHLLGYCLGGTLTSIHTAVFPEHVQSMVTLAAPVSFRDDGLLSKFSNVLPLDLDALVDAFGNVPWQLMQFGFHLLRPTMNLSKAVYMLDRAWDDEFLDGFFALETWGNDNVSLPGEFFKKYIQELYREDRLLKGEFDLDGARVHLEKIEFPVLTITFEHDNIVPSPSAAALHETISSADKEHLHLKGGHVGAVVSRKASLTLWPKISTWYRERDGAESRVRVAS